MKLAAPAGVLLAGCLLAATLLSGCGLGPGKSEGTAKLLITENYGSKVLAEKSLDGLTQSTTVMRGLDDNADIDTKYGGGFVSSINGISNGTSGGRSTDWFYFVNGVAGDRGAAEYNLSNDDHVWWDFRDWTSAAEAQAVVGAFPQPLVGGFDGLDPGVSLDCMGGGTTCKTVEAELKGLGANVTLGSDPGRIRVLVGPWSKVGTDDTAKTLGEGPGASGVFASFSKAGSGYDLEGLGVKGQPVRNFGTDAGLIAATRKNEDMPVWVITAGSEAALGETASALRPQLLAHHYAAVIFDNRIAALPLPG